MRKRGRSLIEDDTETLLAPQMLRATGTDDVDSLLPLRRQNVASISELDPSQRQSDSVREDD